MKELSTMRLPKLSPGVDRRDPVPAAGPLRGGVRPQEKLCNESCGAIDDPECPTRCPCTENNNGGYFCTVP